MEFVVLDEFWGDVEFYDAGAVWVIVDVSEEEGEIFRLLGLILLLGFHWSYLR